MICLGPGGTAGLGYELGIQKIAELGLNALEVEFTYGVKMLEEQAKVIGELAKKNNISLSVHGPYYINLATKEKPKLYASIQRILQSCERAHNMGATHVVYHSGFFQKDDPQKVKESIIEATKLIMEKIKENKWKTKIAPELTGKPTQFGSIPELLELRDSTGCEITIDFAHEKARRKGNIDYAEIFDQLKGMKHIHSHFSGIEWTDKGERNHKITEREDILPLAKEILKRKADITIINESPDPIGDAYKTKEIFNELKE
jgi:deoxyribonuclease IV